MDTGYDAGPVYAGGSGLRLIAEVLGQLDLERPLDQLVSWASSPPEPTISSPVLAPASSSSITSSGSRPPPGLADRRTHPRTVHRIIDQLPGGPHSDVQPAPTRPARTPEPCYSLLPRLAILALVDMKLLFADAYTDPRTLPGRARLPLAA